MLFIGTLISIFIFSALGYYFYYRSKSKQTVAKSLNPPSMLNPYSDKISENLDLINLKNTDEGYDFEKFIVGRFAPKYFSLKHWRGDKFFHGIYPLTSLDPDLLYEFHNGSTKLPFAVECKWRACYKNGFIDWAKDYQVRNYYDFQYRENIPVFIMIGIGNLPLCPAELYIVPLENIPSNWTLLHFDFLRHFKRFQVDKMFFLNPETMLIS